MANTTSAKKATRKIARRTIINKSRRTQMRGAVRLVEDAIEDILEAVREKLPHLSEVVEEVPVVVLDLPTPAMLRDLGIDPNDEEEARSLCGLHSGTMNPETSEPSPTPSQLPFTPPSSYRQDGSRSGVMPRS